MENKKLKTRGEIDARFQWNLEALYATEDLWEQDAKKLEEMTQAFLRHRGHVADSAISLLTVMQESDELQRILQNLYAYAHMRQDQDSAVSKYQEMQGRAMGMIAQTMAATSFLTPELLCADEETILGYLKEEPGLAQYDFALRKILKTRPHVLTEVEESILAQLTEVTEGAQGAFGMLNNADLEFGFVDTAEGKVQLTQGNYIGMLQSYDRNVRQQAYTQLYDTYKKHINTIASLYNTSVKNDVITAKVRHYDSARQAAVKGNEIPEAVYDNLIDAVHQYLPVMHRYLDLRRKALGLEELTMYDVYVPLVQIPEKEIPFEECLSILNESLVPLGQDYLDKVNQGVQDGWIDIYENKGKRSGAYSGGSYDSYPYILLNYTGKLQDVLTTVHEMGHSMHSLYTRENQPITYGDYSIFVAEVASTVNECLLLHHLLGKDNEPEMEQYLVNRFLEEFRATVFRQTMFAEFELAAHRYVESGGSLTPEWLCNEYQRLNTLYYGPAVAQDDIIQYEWARIPHFYSAFYVYQYATGFSAATALSDKILNEGPQAVANYKKFLSMGSSDYPVNALKVAGVDMSQKEPVLRALEMFRSLVDRMEALLA